MFTIRNIWVLAALSSIASAGEPSEPMKSDFGFGRIAKGEEIARADIDVRFDGLGLPPGRGSAAEGALIYSARCALCHGSELEGNPNLGGRPLVGNDRHAVNNLPYAPPLFAYIRRAMPLTAPGSLSDNEVYGLVAFLLTKAGVSTAPDLVLDAPALAAVEMPNRDGFFADSGSGVALPRSPRRTQ
jgi:mono/diheme cytochrome c family protein